MTISYSFLHITLRSFHSQLCKHIVHPSTRTLQKFFFVPARDKGFVISRKYSTQTTRDIIIISNKLNQLPLFQHNNPFWINTARRNISKHRLNQSKIVVEKTQRCQFIAIRYMKGGYVSAVLYRVLRFTANSGGEVRPSPYLSLSLSPSLRACVRACVRPANGKGRE